MFEDAKGTPLYPRNYNQDTPKVGTSIFNKGQNAVKSIYQGERIAFGGWGLDDKAFDDYTPPKQIDSGDNVDRK